MKALHSLSLLVLGIAAIVVLADDDVQPAGSLGTGKRNSDQMNSDTLAPTSRLINK